MPSVVVGFWVSYPRSGECSSGLIVATLARAWGEAIGASKIDRFRVSCPRSGERSYDRSLRSVADEDDSAAAAIQSDVHFLGAVQGVSDHVVAFGRCDQQEEAAAAGS